MILVWIEILHPCYTLHLGKPEYLLVTPIACRWNHACEQTSGRGFDPTSPLYHAQRKSTDFLGGKSFENIYTVPPPFKLSGILRAASASPQATFACRKQHGQWCSAFNVLQVRAYLNPSPGTLFDVSQFPLEGIYLVRQVLLGFRRCLHNRVGQSRIQK